MKEKMEDAKGWLPSTPFEEVDLFSLSFFPLSSFLSFFLSFLRAFPTERERERERERGED